MVKVRSKYQRVVWGSLWCRQGASSRVWSGGPYGEGKEQVTEGGLGVLMVKARSKWQRVVRGSFLSACFSLGRGASNIGQS